MRGFYNTGFQNKFIYMYMEKLNIIQIALLLLISLLSIYLGNVLSIKVPELNKLFDRKPFNCRPCLTFHLMWFFWLLTALLYNSWVLLVLGVIIAFTAFIIAKVIDQGKIRK